MFTLLAGRVHPIRHRIEVEYNDEIPVWAIALGIGIIAFVAGWYGLKLYRASRTHNRPA